MVKFFVGIFLLLRRGKGIVLLTNADHFDRRHKIEIKRVGYDLGQDK